MSDVTRTVTQDELVEALERAMKRIDALEAALVASVPCDDAAVERAAAVLSNLDALDFYTMSELAQAVLRAAGDAA